MKPIECRECLTGKLFLKLYKKSPLPFVGQKRHFLPHFINLLQNHIPDNGRGWTVADVFGGSGLLAHAAKRTLPEARVVYNDFDGFARRIALIPTANVLRRELYAITQNLSKDERIGDADKATMAAVIARYRQPELLQTLACWLLFSGQQVSDLDGLLAANWYNRVPKSDVLPADDYLAGLELMSEPFWDVLPRFSGSPKTLLVLDPPYVSTKQGAYANEQYFGMVQFLRLANLVKPPFVLFSSTRSEALAYADFIVAEQIHNWRDWAGYQCLTLDAALNYQARYEDNMVYKF